MSTIKICDWCHEVIPGDQPHAELELVAFGVAGGPLAERCAQRHYHAVAGRDCFGEVRQSLDLAHEVRNAQAA